MFLCIARVNHYKHQCRHVLQDEDYHKRVEDAVRRRSLDLDSDGGSGSERPAGGSAR